mmetsp:Transcript_8316/g.22877  ORF Transcript_8316/g.22877 Transcript_8316/m.22877 type:complete len:248 (+) Transcript_8316:388-1131(+)
MAGQALVRVDVAVADPPADDVHHGAAGNRPGAAGEHPEGVGGEVVLPGNEAVDVLGGHGVVEALAPEGQEDRKPGDDAHAEGREVHPRGAADEAKEEGRQVRPVGAQGEAVAHAARDHVAEADEDEEDGEEAVFVHRVAVGPAEEGYDLVVEGVEVRWQGALHNEVPDDVRAHEGHEHRQPRLPVQDRLVDGGRADVLDMLLPRLVSLLFPPRLRLLLLILVGRDSARTGNLRGDPPLEEDRADRHA